MKILIDGNNLIFKFPHLEEFMYRESMVGAREGLIELLAEFKEKNKVPDEILLFFDGRKNNKELFEEKVNGIQVYYSQENTADELLMDYIKMNLKSSELVMVTSDKEILFYAKKFKVKSYSSEEFAEIVNEKLSADNTNEKDKEEIQLTSKEVSFWQKLFGVSK